MNENDDLPHENIEGFGCDAETGEEYPVGWKNSTTRLERRAIKEGWLDIVAEEMPALIQKQIADAKHGKDERARRGAFGAIDTAVHRYEQRQLTKDRNELAEQRFDLVTFHQQQREARIAQGTETAGAGETIESHALTPEHIARQVIAMQNAIEPPTATEQDRE